MGIKQNAAKPCIYMVLPRFRQPFDNNLITVLQEHFLLGQHSAIEAEAHLCREMLKQNGNDDKIAHVKFPAESALLIAFRHAS